jgi:hypothetical protein
MVMVYIWKTVFAFEDRYGIHYGQRQEALPCLCMGVRGFVAGMIHTYSVFQPPLSHVGVLFQQQLFWTWEYRLN